MHILMLSDVYFPRINGVSTSIETFRQEFQAVGDQVTLMVPDYPGATEEEGIIRIPSHRIPFDPEDRRMELGTILAQEALIRRMKVDVIHIQTPFIAHYAGVALGKKLGIPCIETYHTLFEEYLHHYIHFVPKYLLRQFARLFSRRQCNALAGVIVPSRAMAETLAAYGISAPTRVVPTGIPLAHFGKGDGLAFRARLGLGPEVPIALFVGRVAGEKNIGFLLEAHRHALNQIPDLHLVVAGEGPALASLRQQAETLGTADKVRFVGYLHRRDELPSCYAAANAFVFASRTETQGLVLLEAMAEGIPVVALSIMGTRDILEPGRGALSPADNPQDFADSLTGLLRNRELHQSLSAEARTYVQEWSARECAERLRQALAQLLQSHMNSHPQTPCTSSPVG
ncbi:glycosyl transferase family 1 [Azospira sp. I13]|uniref:glycosyltransferase n=1 Tax=Azospira sp. I13 TaxID=1765050 RepID=UPI000D4163ED|nr:glycosyltransferase [Azospira sp. I13]GBG01233.1 glycosyl transferase family 1 [Azospira sp. I13]